MIPYVLIRDTSLTAIGIIDTAKSVIWHSVYFGVGDFEIFAQATEQNLNLLKVGYYVARQDNDEIGVIEEISVDFTPTDGYMISASGRFAKSILDRRLIYKLSGTVNTPTILRGNVEQAARLCVKNNAIDTTDANRKISVLGLAALNNIPAIIVDENGNPSQVQVSYQNLLDYTDGLLQEYGLGAKLIYNDSNKKLLYSVYQGADRSTANTAGNDEIIFSIDYDNLNSSNYDYTPKNERTAALIGGAGEGLERFYSLLANAPTGLNRREIFVDASSVNKKYTDDQDVEHEYTDAEYTAMLNQQGKKTLSTHIARESFTGVLNATFGMWIYGRDYFLGDIVTIQDNKLGKYDSKRIIEVTEVQDDNGYNIDVVFGD